MKEGVVRGGQIVEKVRFGLRRKAGGGRRVLSLLLTFLLALSFPPSALAEVADSFSSRDATAPTAQAGAAASGRAAEAPISEVSDLSTADEVSFANADGDPSRDFSGSSSLYYAGVIQIHSFEQLCLVGTGAYLTDRDADSASVGEGDYVRAEDGSVVSYSLNASYRLVTDISIPSGELWTLPDGFTGGFVSSDDSRGEEPLLYDESTDTVFIHNLCQLNVLAADDAADQVVLDGDADAALFGTGKPVMVRGEPLTYSPEHSYVVAADFTEEPPESSLAEQVAAEVKASSTNDGRSFASQVLKEIDGKTYILVGNAEQLRAIGSDDTVHTAVYQAVLRGLHWEVDEDENGDPIMLYGGDADLLASQNGEKDYSFGSIDKAEGGLLETVGRCGVDQETGEIDPNMGIDESGATYADDANYIIFRDIDLNDLNADATSSNWRPLTFSGEIIGAKAEGDETLWDDASTAIASTGRPTISNLRVFQNDPLDVGESMGVGFFATLYGEAGEGTGVLGSVGSAKVSGIVLYNATVQTNTSETHYDASLINSLTKLIGGLLGGLLDIVLGLLGIHVDLSEVLTDLLDARKADPTALATGVLAGRVVGEVSIENCDVISSNVSSVNSSLGGFIGYSEGIVNYGTKELGDAVKLLTNILNEIPGVGLGDLVTILLENGLAVGKLVPVGYTAPVLSDCHVRDLNPAGSSLGVDGSSYVGGFVGLQIGSDIDGCTVSSGSLSVRASSFGGGFAGLVRDAEIEGLLSDVGIELVRFAPQSTIANSAVSASRLSVAGGDYLGGFAGALANSYAVGDDVTAQVSVAGAADADASAKGTCVGGFAGAATTGWVTNLGVGQSEGDNLLGNVGELLDGLLSSNPDQAHGLLSLAGVAPSGVLGCLVNGGAEASGNAVEVEGESYVGGIIGKGDALCLGASTPENLAKLPGWDAESPAVSSRVASLSGLKSVTAHERYAGGVAGSLGAASVGGLLNGALGLASFLGFYVDGVNVSGAVDAYAVSARHYAGGAFGEAVGGDARAVNVKGVSSIEAQSYSGGFAGVIGPGDLASTGGLTLNLLGLDKLLKLDSLLSVIPGVRVSMGECVVEGAEGGMDVSATGGESWAYAGGFASYCNSAELSGCRVSNLGSVVAPDATGSAGGFAGVSSVGDLADLAGEDGGLTVGGSLIEASNLLGTVGYLIPEYKDCTASYVEGGFVRADIAGGFAGELQSGKVDNSARAEEDRFAVYNIDRVVGQSYAGGFGGIVRSGALTDAGKGISILGDSGINIDVTGLVELIEAYVPFVTNAGVKSDNGFTVEAAKVSDADVHAGSAGGFAGYASGAQISGCDVTSLKKTHVVAPEDLEAQDAPSYFDGSSSYSVHGGRYAGGFIGCADIGSAASVGQGLGVLGSTLSLASILSALQVVVTTVEHSRVSGCAGGFSVLADARDSGGSALGCAGGFTGAIYGGHVQNSHVENFEYVIGQVAAGGFTGKMEPGDVASMVSDAGILGNLVSVNETLASLLQTFVPTVRNSTAGCVPCGGAVRAQALSGAGVVRGMAGGFVGCNRGGSIWGNSSDSWKDAVKYAGPMSECRIDRVRSVYGAEYAGGFTGVMEAANAAEVGSLNVLNGLISVDNVLGALSTVYATQRSTSVHGPLANLSVDTWNKWVDYVGVNGGFGVDLAVNGKVETQDQLNAMLGKYVYGCNVVAGRSVFAAGTAMTDGGAAGGYAGLIRSGVVEDGTANDIKSVEAMRAAGGYAGVMEAGGAAKLGGVSILGLNIDLGSLLQAVDVFVPVVKGSSSVVGYASGMTVRAFGEGSADADAKDGCGFAGGYVGLAKGAQIAGDVEGATGCNVENLRMVKGTNAVGGYVGSAVPGTVATANANASEGILQGVLDTLIGQPGDLVGVLEATMTTIRGASVSPDDAAWGYVVDGSFEQGGATAHASAVGGFVGAAEAAILGDDDGATRLKATGVRAVTGGEHVGGFVGLADVGSVASVGDSGQKTSVLHLIGLGNVTALDAFRTYVYAADVAGVSDGLQIRSEKADVVGEMDSTRYFGNAGGFAGSLLNGSVKDSSVENLLTVEAPSYAGGFAGYLGKNGTVDIDSANVGIGKVFELLGAQAGVLDVWGSHVERCSVSGVSGGCIVSSAARADQSPEVANGPGAHQIAGGFVGLGDLSRISDCSASNLGLVRSDQVAGGFIGQTDMSFAVDAQVSSKLVNLLLTIVDQLVRLLYVGKAEDLGAIDLSGLNIPGLGDLLGLGILSDGNLLYVNLLGLKVSVALSKADPDDPSGQTSDVAIVTIGDSTIKLPCDKDGLLEGEDNAANIEITLIKGNRTVVSGSSASGAAGGYDVFGGGATQQTDGTSSSVGGAASADAAGFAGGFVGHNKEGVFESNAVEHCDVVRGASGLVGPFSGKTDLKSTYEPLSKVDAIEGEDGDGGYNEYSIYRPSDASLTEADTAADRLFAYAEPDVTGDEGDSRYRVRHFATIGLSAYEELKGAVMTGDGGVEVPMNAYISPAKAVLMDDFGRDVPSGGITPEPGEGQDPCDANVQITFRKVWNDDADSGGFRPESISFKLFRSWTDASGSVHKEQVDADASTPDVVDAFVLTSADASEWSETWRKVVSGLPVATEDATVDPAQTCYYTYSAEEVAYGEYVSDVSYGYTVSQDETGYVVTITNSLPLPNTGGAGIAPYLWAAILCLAAGAAWLVLRQRRELSQVAGAHAASGAHASTEGAQDAVEKRGIRPSRKEGLHARKR